MCRICGQHRAIWHGLCLYCYGDRTLSAWEQQEAAPPPIPHSVERVVVTPPPSWWSTLTAPYLGILRRYTCFIGSKRIS